MSVRDIDLAIGRDYHCANRTQIVWTITGHSGLAQSHQYPAVRAELDKICALTVPCNLVTSPDITISVHIETMRNG